MFVRQYMLTFSLIFYSIIVVRAPNPEAPTTKGPTIETVVVRNSDGSDYVINPPKSTCPTNSVTGQDPNVCYCPSKKSLFSWSGAHLECLSVDKTGYKYFFEEASRNQVVTNPDGSTDLYFSLIHHNDCPKIILGELYLWDILANGNSDWVNDWNYNLRQYLTVVNTTDGDNGGKQLRELKVKQINRAQWRGLLFKVYFQCTVDYISKMMLLKFPGTRLHPISNDGTLFPFTKYELTSTPGTPASQTPISQTADPQTPLTATLPTAPDTLPPTTKKPATTAPNHPSTPDPTPNPSPTPTPGSVSDDGGLSTSVTALLAVIAVLLFLLLVFAVFWWFRKRDRYGTGKPDVDEERQKNSYIQQPNAPVEPSAPGYMGLRPGIKPPDYTHLTPNHYEYIENMHPYEVEDQEPYIMPPGHRETDLTVPHQSNIMANPSVAKQPSYKEYETNHANYDTVADEEHYLQPTTETQQSQQANHVPVSPTGSGNHGPDDYISVLADAPTNKENVGHRFSGDSTGYSYMSNPNPGEQSSFNDHPIAHNGMPNPMVPTPLDSVD